MSRTIARLLECIRGGYSSTSLPSLFEGAMILVSHVPEFVAQIRIDDILDLEK